MRDGVPALRTLLYRDGAGGFTPERADHGLELLSLTSARQQMQDKLRAPVAKPSDLACLIYTAGTTGPSKGCMISHNYRCTSPGSTRGHRPTHRDKTFTPLPLFHLNAWNVTVFTTASCAARCDRAALLGVRLLARSRAFRRHDDQLLGTMVALIANAPDSEAAERCFGQIHMVRGKPFTEENKKVWRGASASDRR